MNEIVIDGPDNARIKNLGATDTGPVLGGWYWFQYTPEVVHKEGTAADEGEVQDAWWEQHQYVRETAKGREILVCVMAVGTNYVKIATPGDSNRDFRSSTSWRVHIKDFWERLVPELEAETIIRGKIAQCQQHAAVLLGQINEVTQRLGMSQQQRLGAPSAPSGNALMAMSSTPDISGYKNALVEAKDKQLPDLFKELKESHGALAVWMTAPAMAMLAQVGDLKDYVEEIDGRIFSISLYAGLTEEAVEIAGGEPADIGDKLHVMQRMLFMDEEGLLDYQHGGMDFRKIGDFDRFLAQPHNRDRILPFPRTLVAMQVRRNKKGREAFSLSEAFVNMQMEEADRWTFLFVRNGDRVYRISCDMEFGELVFPTRGEINPLEPKMMKRSGSEWVFMSVDDYEQRKQQQIDLDAAQDAFREQWRIEHPEGRNDWMEYERTALKDGTRWPGGSPIGGRDFDYHSWSLFSPDNVFYDDAMKQLDREMREYNRVALIIQGLFDRSQVLHPHLPVQTWTPQGFEAAIRLLYDGSDVLHYGEAPDFEAYRLQCNKSIKAGTLCIGQHDFWQRAMAEKENERLDRLGGRSYRSQHTRFKPSGNPGPHDPGPVDAVGKAGGTFRWERERQRQGRHAWQHSTEDQLIADKITVPLNELLNIEAYKLGDYKQFFQDPRTRAKYLQWAPLLLRAEEWAATQAGLPKGQGRMPAQKYEGWDVEYNTDGSVACRSKTDPRFRSSRNSSNFKLL